MNPELWQRVAEIAGEALEKPAGERESYARTRCGDDPELLEAVLEMLAANQEMGDFLDTDPESEDGGAAAPLPLADEFGPYRAIREIGHGGMSLVYLGERSETGFTQRVAIKVILHKSPGVLQESETKILSRLEHPNIARFLDAGVTKSGLRYLVMEYVDGVPCTEHARTLPDEKARLRLFLQICAAVQYANRSLIVHRDLKPGNVLVDREGLPKLLDFGIAKILDPEPGTASATVGTRAYTPDYASPEQILGEPVTTATDVYSLGVLLCEMVGGKRPRAMLELPMPEVIRMARTEVSEVPFQGDLAAIARKALRCDPAQRYESAAELARDIERYLEGRPITARDPSWTYTAARFIQRNRIAVAATTLAVLAIGAAGGTALWQARLAARRFQQVRSLANSVLFELHDSIEKLPGSLASRQLLVKRSLEYLDTLAADSTANAELQIEVAKGFVRLGDIESSYSMGETASSQRHFDKSLAVIRRVVADHPRNLEARRQLFISLDNSSSGYESMGQYDKAIALAVEAKRVAWETYGMFASDPDVRRDKARSAYVLAFTYNRSRTHTEKAVPEAEVALAAWKEILRGDPEDLIAVEELSKVLRMLGTYYFEKQKYEESRKYQTEALELDRRVAAKTPGKEERVAFGLGQLAVLDSVQGNREEAIRLLTEQLEIRKMLMERDPANYDALRRYGVSLNRICDTYVRMRNAEEAIRYGEQAAAVQRKVYAKDPSNILVNREYLYALVDLAHGYGIRKQKEKYCPLVQEAEPLLHGPLEKTAETIGDRTRKSDVRKTLPRCAAAGF